jgi:hypothetical protein
LISHNCFITFLAVVQQSNVKLTQVCRAQAGRQVISAALAAPQREILNLNSVFEKADRLLEQNHTSSQYDKNEQLTLLSPCKLAFTGRNIS